MDGWDGMVIIGHRSSKSTYGTNKIVLGIPRASSVHWSSCWWPFLGLLEVFHGHPGWIVDSWIVVDSCPEYGIHTGAAGGPTPWAAPTAKTDRSSPPLYTKHFLTLFSDTEQFICDRNMVFYKHCSSFCARGRCIVGKMVLFWSSGAFVIYPLLNFGLRLDIANQVKALLA